MQEGGGGEAAIQSAIQRAQERALAADVAATRAEQRNLPEADRVDPATAAANANAAVAAMLQAEADAESGGDEDQVRVASLCSSGRSGQTARPAQITGPCDA